MSDQQRFNAVFARIQALYDRTFPASAGWRPNIQVSIVQADAAAGSPTYRALQLANMMRAIEINGMEGGSSVLRTGMRIKDIDRLLSSQGGASPFHEMEPLRHFSLPQEIDKAETWLARQTNDTAFFARKTAETGRALTTSTRAMEEFTRTVNQRLRAEGVPIPEGGIPMSLLNTREQARFEALHNDFMYRNTQLMAALHAEHPTLSYDDIKARADQLRTAAETSARGRGPASTRIIHPSRDKAIPRIEPGPEFYGFPPGMRDPGELQIPPAGRIETRAPDGVLDRAQRFVVAQTGDYSEPRVEDELGGSGVGARAVERSTPARAVS